MRSRCTFQYLFRLTELSKISFRQPFLCRPQSNSRTASALHRLCSASFQSRRFTTCRTLRDRDDNSSSYSEPSTYTTNHPPRLHNLTSIITGSSSGLGRAAALQFASHGPSLVVCADISPNSRPSGPLDDEHANIPTHDLINATYGPGRAIYIKTDITSSKDCEHLVITTLSHISSNSRIDSLVNCAGVGSPSGSPLLHDLEEDAWDKVMNVNLRGTFLTNKFVLRQMITQPPQPLPSSSTLSAIPPPGTGPVATTTPELHPLSRRGTIINIASMLSTIALPNGTAAYCASKGAVLNLTKQLALDYAPHLINVNAVCPGFLKTAMTQGNWGNESTNREMIADTPWGRWGRVEDVARVIVGLASEDGAWIVGEGVVVDGGYSAR